MNDASEFEPVIDLANEYLQRYRDGENPTVEEYAARYPDLADRIRDVFPMMLLMEDNAPEATETDKRGEIGSATHRLESLGDFRILREIGRGGMGIVYEAVQESLGRHVALKVFPRHAHMNPRNQERFKRESRSAAMLHHTNIVPVFAVGDDDGMLYYAMQLIRGTGLDEVITELNRLGPVGQKTIARTRTRPHSVVASQVAMSMITDTQSLEVSEEPSSETTKSQSDNSAVSGVHLPGQSDDTSLSETGKEYWHSVARIGVQVAEALDYAHNQGTLHRDIKPSNLLLDQDATVWVTDFGLAKSLEQDDLTHTGELVGTLRYMPPEQFVGDSDERSDLYSLGLTLYELVTLRPAFDMPDRQRLVKAITDSVPQRPRKLNSRIPRDLETIVLKSIEREPNHRYGTAQDLADDLTRFLNSEPLRAKPISSYERFFKWAKRRPAIASLAAALLTLFVVSFGLVTWKWREAEVAKAQVKIERDEALASERAEREAKLNEAHERKRKEELLKKSEQNLYYSQIAQANLQLQQNDIQKAEHTLMSVRRELRGWEWNYLHGQLTPEVVTLAAGTEATPWIYCLDFSDDGKFLATGAGIPDFLNAEIGAPGAARIWELATGKKVVDFQDKTKSVVGIAFAPGGDRLAICDYDIRGRDGGRLRIWDISTKAELVSMRNDDGQDRASGIFLGLSFSPNGKYLAGRRRSGIRAYGAHFVSRDQLWVWDANTGECLWKRIIGNVSYEFSEDSQYISTRIDKGWGHLDLENGHIIKQYPQDRGYLDPSGQFIFSWGNNAVRVQETGDIKHRIRDPAGGITTFELRPDCCRVATAGLDGAIREWDLASGTLRQMYQGHSSKLLSLEFSDQGQYLASGDWNGTVKVWKTLNPRRNFGSHRFVSDSVGRIEDMAFQSDERALVLISTAGQLQMRETRTGDLIQQHWIDISIPQSGPLRTAAFDGSGRLLVGVDSQNRSTLKIWDVATGNSKFSYPDSDQSLQQSIYRVAFSTNGNRVAAAAGNFPSLSDDKRGTLKVWEVPIDQTNSATTTPALSVEQDGIYFTGVALDRLGKKLAACSYVKTETSGNQNRKYFLSIWNVDSGKKTELPSPADQVNATVFSDDGQSLAVGERSGKIKVFDTESGQIQVEILGPNGLEDLAFSPDGTRLAGVTRLATRIWDTKTGHEVITLRSEQRPGDPIFNPTILFSRSGDHLVSSKWHAKYSFMIWSTKASDRQGTDDFWSAPISNLSSTIDSHPENASFRRVRGKFLAAAGETESAQQDFVTAARIEAGQKRNGMSMDPSAHIVAPHIPFYRYPSFTVEAWVRDWSGDLIHQTTKSNLGLRLTDKTATFLSYRLEKSDKATESDDRRIRHRCRLSFAQPSEGWSHVAIVRDKDRMFSFSNGKLISTFENVPAASPLNQHQPLLIGGLPANHFFAPLSGQGAINSIRISKTARYRTEFTPQANLVVDEDSILLYDFSQLQDQLNSEIKDLSNNQRHGQLTNAWWLQ